MGLLECFFFCQMSNISHQEKCLWIHDCYMSRILQSVVYGQKVGNPKDNITVREDEAGSSCLILFCGCQLSILNLFCHTHTQKTGGRLFGCFPAHLLLCPWAEWTWLDGSIAKIHLTEADSSVQEHLLGILNTQDGREGTLLPAGEWPLPYSAKTCLSSLHFSSNSWRGVHRSLWPLPWHL